MSSQMFLIISSQDAIMSLKRKNLPSLKEYEEAIVRSNGMTIRGFRNTEDCDWSCVYIFENCKCQGRKKSENISTNEKCENINWTSSRLGHTHDTRSNGHPTFPSPLPFLPMPTHRALAFSASSQFSLTFR